MSLTVQTEQRADVVVVSVAGELDMATAPQLQDQISDLLEKGRTRLVFDLAEVSFCDSTGLSVFVRAKNSTDDAGGMVRLAAPQRGVLTTAVNPPGRPATNWAEGMSRRVLKVAERLSRGRATGPRPPRPRWDRCAAPRPGR